MQVRDWLYVADHAGAIDHVLRNGTAGEVYNVPGANLIPNRGVVELLLARLGKPWSLVRFVEDRPGHDRRYAMDGAKLAALGWANRVAFADGLASTIDWFRANEAWWRAARTGEWDAYYERQYAGRLAGSTAGRGRQPGRHDGRRGRLMRVAVTGAGGRLGRALMSALRDAPFTGPLGPLAWSRPTYDIDDPEAAARCIRQMAPEVVVHAAAWTDVDGCAREPERAMRRNAMAVAELAEACVRAGTDLVLVSTNEVFDGRRTDGRGYAPGDRPRPNNPYGSSKLAGETAAQAAFLHHGGLIGGPGAPALAPGGADGRPATTAPRRPAAGDRAHRVAVRPARQ